MTNGFEKVAKLFKDARYQERKHGDDGYNLYQDMTTKKFWIGTEDNPRQVWLVDPAKIEEAQTSSSFKHFIPSYLQPANEPLVSKASHRSVRDVSASDLAEHSAGFHAPDAPAKDVEVTGVDPNVEIQALLMAGL
ncbi:MULTISPECIES: hypothetical protein [unclassified Chelatococcus]|uniref:hypothetical protein n=1 Tax=unclassified Chelatococcus TaxID=2638111 RepID=UPI001BCE9DB8|nr:MULTISPECIES: hypothetical protein [unclassified Chelatococcus]MBS7697015.1 hypothetical protein [Chelatococcus sp. YT9]MBX3556005.1 hypothetical protein [Chelatococcus sp.]